MHFSRRRTKVTLKPGLATTLPFWCARGNHIVITLWLLPAAAVSCDTSSPGSSPQADASEDTRMANTDATPSADADPDGSEDAAHPNGRDCNAAGGTCRVPPPGDPLCTQLAPNSDQDCNLEENPGGGVCCVPGADAGVDAPQE